MANDTLYSLTWNEFGTSLVSSVQLLQCHGELVDVTLTAGGQAFYAHKLVLCAASPFLLDLLKTTTCKHPVVMLAGVQAADLEALLEFVYRGEVSVNPDQLPSLLQAAHCLNIQGLAPTSISSRTSIDELSASDQIETVKYEKTFQQNSELLHFEENVISGKHRKRTKGLIKSSGECTPRKRVCIQPESTIENEIPEAEMGDTNDSHWSQKLHTVNEKSKINTMSNQLTCLDQTTSDSANTYIEQPANTTNNETKMKCASDQPGTCLLCGAMFRQARNLRRHLLASCKFRTINGSPQSSTGCSPPQLNRSFQDQSPQPTIIASQNFDRSSSNDGEIVDQRLRSDITSNSDVNVKYENNC